MTGQGKKPQSRVEMKGYGHSGGESIGTSGNGNERGALTYGRRLLVEEQEESSSKWIIGG